MPGILIQTVDVKKFAKLMGAILPNVDISDRELTLQIDGEGFDDYPVSTNSSIFTAGDGSPPDQEARDLKIGPYADPFASLQSPPFSDSDNQGSAAPHGGLESLETSEDCARPYPIGLTDPGYTHNISNQKRFSNQAMTLTDQIEALKQAYKGLRMWNMAADGVRKMLEQHGIQVIEHTNANIKFIDPEQAPVSEAQLAVEFVGDCKLNQAPNVANSTGSASHRNGSGDIANYHWAVGRVQNYRANDLMPSINGASYFGDGDIARLICKLIEESETLERSELYRQRIAGICTAALGYGPAPDQIHQHYRTPAYNDVHKLYLDYSWAHDCLNAHGFVKQEDGRWRKRDAEEQTIDQVAEIYEGQAAQSADRTIADLQAQCAKLRQELRKESAEATRYANDCGELRKQVDQLKARNAKLISLSFG